MDPELLVVHSAALSYLGIFVNPAFTPEQRDVRLLEMKPREEDYAKVFAPKLVEQARALYTMLWSNPPPLRGKPEQTVIWLRTARTQDFVEWNRTGQEFPGGYRKLAPNLVPGVVWIAWKFIEPGEISGLSFDGLTWLGDRFVWFPQPWRLVPIG